MNDHDQSVEALQLAALVYNHSHQAMMVLDADGTYLDVNPRFTTLTGFTREDVIGRRLDVLRSGPDTSDFHRTLWTALREHGHWAGEVWNRRKNGEVYPEWLELSVVRDAHGAVTRYIAQAADVSAKKSNEHHIWRLANYDRLTGLPNRSMFHERLAHEIRRAHRSGKKLALLFLDLDGFKEVNDNLGHDAGDLLLQHVSDRLAGCVRESDTVARLGGDEFIVILNDIADMAVVGTVAQKIVDTLAATFQLQGHTVHVSASAGITLYPDDGATHDVLLKHADQAMYAAKRAGRNRYCYFTTAMQEQAQHRARLVGELRLALNTGCFQVVYEPIVDLRTGQIVAAEALLRWQHPRDGLVSPDVFVPIAAEAGLAPALGNFVLRRALLAARQLGAIEPGFTVGMNRLSAEFDDSEMAAAEEGLCDLLAQARHDGARLAMELTENQLLDLRPGVQRQLQALRAAGLQLVIDDYGTGRSSLAQLRELGISGLKVPGTLVSGLVAGVDEEVLCDAMITVAHRLGMHVVAAGVETQAQRLALLGLGCDYAQGSLFAPPLAAELLADLLHQQVQQRQQELRGQRGEGRPPDEWRAQQAGAGSLIQPRRQSSWRN